MTPSQSERDAGLPPVCILAGGLGTRLGGQAATVPKSLMRVGGAPFLFHQLRLLSKSGATKIVLCVGHLGEQIVKEVGSSQFGLGISYSFDSPGLDGTLGAVQRALPMLGEMFLILYGDAYLQVDYQAFSREWLASSLMGGMVVFHNRERWDRSNASYASGRVVAYDKGNPSSEMEWIDFGLSGLRAEAVATYPAHRRELSELYRDLAASGQLFGFEAANRFYEIGTPSGLAETDAYIKGLEDDSL